MSNTQGSLDFFSPSVSAETADTCSGCGYCNVIIIEPYLGLSRLLNSCLALGEDLEIGIQRFGGNIEFCDSCVYSEKVAKNSC